MVALDIVGECKRHHETTARHCAIEQETDVYTPDQQVISTWALESPRQLFEVGLFIQCTINTHFEQVPGMMAEARQEGRNSKYWNPTKRRAYDALLSESQSLWHDFRWWHTRRQDTGDNADITEAAIARLVDLPGFGIVKAAFMAQLVLGLGGCLDRHNLRKAGLDERIFQRIPSTAEGLHARIKTYVQTCLALGGSEALWNQWATMLSVARPASFPTADHVSRWHVTCLCGDSTRHPQEE